MLSLHSTKSTPTEDIQIENQTDESENMGYTNQMENNDQTKDIVDSISKLYVIIYVLSFMMVFFIIVITIVLFLYCKKSLKKSESVKKPNQRRNREIELELSTHDYESVHDYDCAEAPHQAVLSVTRKGSRKETPQIDHLKFVHAAKLNTAILDRFHNMHPRMASESTYQN